MKHTPGPWILVSKDSPLNVNAVAEVGDDWYIHADAAFGDVKADALLMVASPDLLAACEYGHDEHALDRLALKLEGTDGFSGFVLWLKRKAELERAAIIKARGEDR